MFKLSEPLLLVRVDARFPVGLKLTTGKFSESWDSVPFWDGRWLGNEAETWGWQFVGCGKRLLRGGFGVTPEDATASALGQALREIKKSVHSARVEYLRVQEYPWFYLGTVAVYPQAMQQLPSGILFQSDTVAAPVFQNAVSRQTATFF